MVESWDHNQQLFPHPQVLDRSRDHPLRIKYGIIEKKIWKENKKFDGATFISVSNLGFSANHRDSKECLFLSPRYLKFRHRVILELPLLNA